MTRAKDIRVKERLYRARWGIILVGLFAALISFGFDVQPTLVVLWMIGVFAYLFLPGWLATFIFFPVRVSGTSASVERGVLNSVERYTLSGAVSIVCSSIVVFALDRLPHADELGLENLLLGQGLMVLVLFSFAARRARWLSLPASLLLGLIVPAVIGLNIALSVPIISSKMGSVVLVLFMFAFAIERFLRLRPKKKLD